MLSFLLFIILLNHLQPVQAIQLLQLVAHHQLALLVILYRLRPALRHQLSRQRLLLTPVYPLHVQPLQTLQQLHHHLGE